MKNIKTTIKIELSDVKEFNFSHYRNSSRNKFFSYFILPIQLPILLLFLISPKESWYLIGFEIVFILLVHFGLNPYILNRRSRKNYRTEKNWSTPLEIEINEEQYIVKGKHFSAETMLSTFHQFVETKNLIVLYKNEFNGSIIPKRFLNQEQLNKLKEILNIKTSTITISKFKSFRNWLLRGILYTIIIGVISSIFFWNTIAVQYLSNKAYNLHQNHKTEEAITVYKEILKRDSVNEFARANILHLEIAKLYDKAYRYHSNEEYDKARKIYNKILNLDKGNEWAKENLNRLPNE